MGDPVSQKVDKCTSTGHTQGGLRVEAKGSKQFFNVNQRATQARSAPTLSRELSRRFSLLKYPVSLLLGFLSPFTCLSAVVVASSVATKVCLSSAVASPFVCFETSVVMFDAAPFDAAASYWWGGRGGGGGRGDVVGEVREDGVGDGVRSLTRVNRDNR